MLAESFLPAHLYVFHLLFFPWLSPIAPLPLACSSTYYLPNSATTDPLLRPTQRLLPRWPSHLLTLTGMFLSLAFVFFRLALHRSSRPLSIIIAPLITAGTLSPEVMLHKIDGNE